MSTSLVIVEDHPDLRQGLELVLRELPEMAVRGVFADCETMLETFRGEDHMADVVLMDIGLPGISGIEGVERVKSLWPACEVLMLTVFEDDDNVFRAVCAGASGYLLKKSSPAEIVQAIRHVREGGVPMTPLIARKVMRMFRDFNPRREENILTKREREVLAALVDGLDYKRIAERLFISLDTVRNHLRHIYAKLQVHSKSEAVAQALKRRLI